MKKLKLGVGEPGTRFVICYLLFVIWFSSCAGAPKTGLPVTDEELYLLPSGARAYLWADAVKARPILEALSFIDLDDKITEQILDSTTSAAAAVFPESQNRRFFLAAAGNYPRSKANLSLTFSKGWKKQKSNKGSSYWYSKNDALALVVDSGLALVSNIDPFDYSEKETPPAGFFEFRGTLALAGWIPGPSGAINNFLNSMGIPLQIPAEDFLFGAARTENHEEPWELVLKIRTPSASHARSILSLFSIARLFVHSGAAALGGIAQGTSPQNAGDLIAPMKVAALLFSNVPEQNEDYLTLRTGAVSEDQLALLFGIFQVYSN